MAGLELRFRTTSPELLALPWLQPLHEWDATQVALRDIPVGPSRHLVRFVEADRQLWALKELPREVALREYASLRVLEDHHLPAVRPAGVVVQPVDDTALLVTRYLDGSWQYRRLLMRVPTSMHSHRRRLLDGMASLLVDLHRNGIYWGDCSLANTLFMRDGQSIQAWMVDAETSEIHTQLSDGQRNHDLDITLENVLGGLMDVAARLEEPPEIYEQLTDEAHGVLRSYRSLWDILHEQPMVARDDPAQIGSRLQRLNDMGFEVDEVRLLPADEADDNCLRLTVDVAGRQFHAEQLRSLTGLEVGEGQAVILLADLRAHQARLEAEIGSMVSEFAAGRRWFEDVLTPGMERAHAAVGEAGSAIQAYCDLLEVRWLLSEQAGNDLGDEPALEALRSHQPPPESAANLGIVDLPTAQLPIIVRRRPDDEASD